MECFEIAKQGKASCGIRAEEVFAPAAEELKKYLGQITGAAFDAAADTYISLETEAHGDCGFAWELREGNLTLLAGNSQAMLYCVYDFLERVCGCGFYASDTEKVPCDPDLALEIEAYCHEPILGYREVYYRDFQDRTFAAKRKADPMQVVPCEAHSRWGYWCHSFGRLLPSKKYFAEHPEYFAEIDGVRREDGQLCLSNPDVLEIVCQNLAKAIAERPDLQYWSVSQDDHQNYCHCPACRSIDEEEGSPMGSLLRFINRVAERFPEKTISTLAYQYTRKPPKITRPGKNVHIMLCNIEALRGESIEDDPRNSGTVEELRAWAKICGNVFLWDYNIEFSNLVNPFPNLNTLAPNIRFFVKNHVRSLFSQCNREIGGEFAELRGYMIARLMWEPELDGREVMLEFLNGYYGAAAPHVLHYIDTMHAACHAAGKPLALWNGPAKDADTYLTPELCKGYMEDWDAAIAAVADDPAAAKHVRTGRLPLLFAVLTLGYGSRDERLNYCAEFAATAREQKLVKVEEWRRTVDNFLTDTLATLN